VLVDGLDNGVTAAAAELARGLWESQSLDSGDRK
jgi:hypothetical protein